jgi:chromosome segregation ATPase
MAASMVSVSLPELDSLVGIAMARLLAEFVNDTRYAHARLDALCSAIDNASRRTDRNSDEIDRLDIEVADLHSRQAEQQDAHNTLVGSFERHLDEAGETLYVVMDKYETLQRRVDAMLDRQLRMEQAQRVMEDRLADSEARQIATQTKLDQARALLARLNARHNV